jgi:DNA-binding transcriptional LysR family regulator
MHLDPAHGCLQLSNFHKSLNLGKRMELRDIEYFAVIAEHRNMRRASEALGMSPGALSKSLRRLEESIQAKLVERTPKGVALTSVGAALLAQVQRLRVTLMDIRREADDLTEGRAGNLRLGVGATTVEDLPHCCAPLLQQAPALSVRITVADNDVMVPALTSGELDLIFNVLPDSPPVGCAQERLFDDVFVVCAAADHPLAKRRRLTMADLSDELWTLSVPAVPNVQYLHNTLRASGLPPPRVAIEARPLRLRLQICASTRLLSFNARRSPNLVAPRWRLKELPVEHLKWRRAVGVIYRKNSYLSPAARRLIDLLRTIATR